MLERFISYIRLNDLCTPADRLLLAVSGGVDSMVMLHLFQQAGFTSLAVAHANFGLRGEESEEDERFVEGYCRTRGIPFFIRHFQTKEYALQHGISIQMAARDLRYAWFNELARAENFTAVATAHSLTDSTETFLLNWLHGASAESLTGIPPKNQRVIRPLLFATRSEIEAYAARHGLTWREDTSNATDAYTRNYLRHHVLPHLAQINAEWQHNAARSMEKLKGTLMLQEEALQLLKEKYVQAHSDDVVIRKELFKKFNHPFILYKLLQPYGFSYQQCITIARLINAQPGKSFLSHSHQLVIDRTTLNVAKHAKAWPGITISTNMTTAELGPWKIIQEFSVSNKHHADARIAVLDAEKLTYPLHWRVWRPGDFFYPLGMNHRKKISDFLTDNKVPLTEKSRVTVLESNGNIVWVVGLRIDNRYKVTPATTRTVRLTVISNFD